MIDDDTFHSHKILNLTIQCGIIEKPGWDKYALFYTLLLQMEDFRLDTFTQVVLSSTIRSIIVSQLNAFIR